MMPEEAPPGYAGNNTPRVAFVINELRFGGAQRVFVDDANGFARAGARVLFCTLYRETHEYPLARELEASIERVSLEARGPFDLGAVVRCARVLRSAGIDVLIATLNDANIFGRWVVLVSGLSVRLVRREANSIESKPLWQRVLDVLLDGLTRRILVVSAADLGHFDRWRVGKVVVMRNAVALPAQAKSHKRAVPRILSVGRMTRQKDHATLVAALGMLARAGQQFTAEIIGDGPLYEAVRDLAGRQGVSERVVFRGTLPHDAVLRAYAQADVFALPSRFEGCPNVVLEAMAYGLPVIATAVGGVPELVEHEVSGLVVPPGNPKAFADALAQVVADVELRAAMGHAARSRAGLFRPEPRFQRLYNLVASV
jgi:glycosyltransferase involved in cell wall biosynthesis